VETTDDYTARFGNPRLFTNVRIRNASERTVWLTSGAFVVPTDLADVRERERIAKLAREGDCVCECDSLESVLECAPPLCLELDEPAPAVVAPARPLEPGAELELGWSGDKRHFKSEASCLYFVGYPTGTALTASLCWHDEDPGTLPAAPPHCLQRTFQYGEEQLDFEIPGSASPSSDEDASAADEDGGAVSDEDGGAR
jgi:hypothetical protein